MRRSFPVFLTVALWALGAGTVAAQITLVPGPAQPVSQAPRFLAAADFNQDGFADAAVSNTVSAKVSVLFGSATGAFSSAIDMSVGRTVRGLVTGDLNQDHIPDIAVADLLSASVFRITSNGNGTFNRPEQFRVGLFPSDIALGNFDGKNGNDLATANSGQNSTTVLLNLGSNRGFTTLGSYGLGNHPKRIDAADVNGDGLDDILAINTGSAGADDVSVLLNSGVGSFGFPTNFITGTGSVDMVVADFNNDGVPDIAVLNAGTVQATPNQFSITILLNRTQVVGGRTIGQGFFDVAPPITVRCPLTISGLAIGCTPTGITAADFDNDGNIDLAISMSTKSLVNSVVTDGLVQAFAGRGDGSFDFATQLNVGAGAAAVVAADFNGDGTQDIAVAEALTKSVRIIRSLAPPQLPNGAKCNLNTQCLSTFCVDRRCCGSSRCGDGQFCDVSVGPPGTCSVPAPNGSRCDAANGHQCQSGNCVIDAGASEGFCCSSASCGAGQTCNSGDCAGAAPNGTQCVEGQGQAECLSGFCTDSVCCVTDVCPPNEYCDIPDFEGNCTLQNPVGSQCTANHQCLASGTSPSGSCVDGYCCATGSCPTGQSCGVPGSVGTCVTRPPNTPTPSPTPIPTATPTAQPNGAPCGDPSQCVSGDCTDGVCCNQAACPASPTGLPEFCNVSFFMGTCHTRGAFNDQCKLPTDCQSGNCSGGHCGLAFTATATATATATRTPTLAPGGAICSNTSQCQSGLVCGNEGVCCTNAVCPSGQSCRVAGSEGTCTQLPTPTPTKIGQGICTGGDVCASGNCVNGQCCDSTCTDPNSRCDITDHTGFCWPLSGLHGPCGKNSDCEPGLICNQATGVCDVIALTPTLPPPPSSTPTTDVVVNTSRSGGGCSIGHGTDGRAAWLLLALLPVAILVRRWRWDHSRVLSRRAPRHQ